MVKVPFKVEFELVKPEILEEYIDEKTGERAMKVRLKWQQADTINRNGRVYSKSLLQREIDKLQPGIKEGEVYGASYHPKDVNADIDDVSHIWKKLWMDESTGECLGEATILPTDRGKNAMVLIKHGGKIGVSSRATGTASRKTKTVAGKPVQFDNINDDLNIVSPGDLVLRPSVPDANIRAIIEEDLSKSYSQKLYEDSSKDEGEKTMDFKDQLKALKEDHEKDYTDFESDLKQGILDSDEFTKKVDEAVEAKKEDWKKEISKDFEVKLEAITKNQDKMVEGIISGINILSEIPGVIPVEENTENKEDEEVDLKKQVEDLQKEITDMKAEKEKAVTDAEAEKEKAETQKEVKKAFNTEVEKEENKPYKTLIEKELVKDERVMIETVEEVAKKVKDAKAHVSEILVEAQKNKIIGTGIDSKGTIKKPDALTEEEVVANQKIRWEQAKNSGYPYDFATYKEKVLGIK